jgi:hypothetical protein
LVFFRVSWKQSTKIFQKRIFSSVAELISKAFAIFRIFKNYTQNLYFPPLDTIFSRILKIKNKTVKNVNHVFVSKIMINKSARPPNYPQSHQKRFWSHQIKKCGKFSHCHQTANLSSAGNENEFLLRSDDFIMINLKHKIHFQHHFLQFTVRKQANKKMSTGNWQMSINLSFPGKIWNNFFCCLPYAIIGISLTICVASETFPTQPSHRRRFR